MKHVLWRLRGFFCVVVVVVVFPLFFCIFVLFPRKKKRSKAANLGQLQGAFFKKYGSCPPAPRPPPPRRTFDQNQRRSRGSSRDWLARSGNDGKFLSSRLVMVTVTTRDDNFRSRSVIKFRVLCRLCRLRRSALCATGGRGGGGARRDIHATSARSRTHAYEQSLNTRGRAPDRFVARRTWWSAAWSAF